jgi:hypothetical protein
MRQKFALLRDEFDCINEARKRNEIFNSHEEANDYLVEVDSKYKDGNTKLAGIYICVPFIEIGD